MPFSSPKRIESVMLAVALLATFTGWALMRAYADSEGWSNHTVQVRRELALLSRDVADTQRGQRGYLITGRAEYKEPYESGRESILTRHAHLVDLTADNRVQQERLAAMKVSIDDLLDELGWTVGQVRTKMKDDAYKMVDTGRGERAIRAIRADLDDCTAEEDRLLLERIQRETLLFRAVITSCILVGIMFGVCLVAVWSRVRIRPRPTVYVGPERRKSW
jgi:CHASE3 domain sensor protein